MSFNTRCKNCHLFEYNKETDPYCVKCCYCKNKKHILQVNIDGTLPKFCHICNYEKWKKEFKITFKKILKKNDYLLLVK